MNPMRLQTLIVEVLNVPLSCSITLRDSSCNHGNWNRFPPVYREAFRCHGNRSMPGCTGVFMLLQCWNKTLWVCKGEIVAHSPSEDCMKCLSSYLKSFLLFEKPTNREMIDVTHLVGWHVYFLGEPPIACCGSQLILKGAECRVSIWRKQIFMFLFCGVKRKKGRVGVKYEDWYTPLWAGGACREISLAYFSSYRSMWHKRFDLAQNALTFKLEPRLMSVSFF